MASGIEFNFEGLEGLERDLMKAVEKAPEEAKETLKELGKEFKAYAKKKVNAAIKHVKRDAGGEKYAISKKWGSRLVGDRLGAAVMVWNSAPHFHLVEDGHVLVRGGRAAGFVEGKHLMEKAREDYRDVVPERFEKMIDNIFKEYGL